MFLPFIYRVDDMFRDDDNGCQADGWLPLIMMLLRMVGLYATSPVRVATPKHVHTVTKSLKQRLHGAGYICSIINTKLLKYGAKCDVTDATMPILIMHLKEFSRIGHGNKCCTLHLAYI